MDTLEKHLPAKNALNSPITCIASPLLGEKFWKKMNDVKKSVCSFPDLLFPTCLPGPKQTSRSLLPSASGDRVLKLNFAVLLSCVLTTHMKFSIWF